MFSDRAWNQYLHWQGDDRGGLERVNALIKECQRDPFRGTGKPEPLGGNLYRETAASGQPVVGAPGEIFGAIGAAVRTRSPAPVTLFAGYANGCLGYVSTPEEYPFGGYEPAVAHRGYGHPAPFAPSVAGQIVDVSLALLDELFPEGPPPAREPLRRP
jgi:hypothetical protein